MAAQRTLTANEAKAIADRGDVWKGFKWMITPTEAQELRTRNDFTVYRKDSPVLTSDPDLIRKIRWEGKLTIARNPNMPAEETDYLSLPDEDPDQEPETEPGFFDAPPESGSKDDALKAKDDDPPASKPKKPEAK
jgi:hypothetical protein